jgi:hypothetical protein
MRDRLAARGIENRDAKAAAMSPFEGGNTASQLSVPIIGGGRSAQQRWPGKQRDGQQCST